MKLPFLSKKQIFNIVDKYFFYLALFIVIVIVVIGVNSFVLPVWRSVRSVDVVQVQQQQKQLDDLNAYLVQLKKMRNQYATIDYRDTKRLEDVLPHSLDTQLLYLQIQDFAKRSGLALSSLNISGGTQNAVADTASRRAQSQTNTSDAVESQSHVQEVSIEMGVAGLETYEQFKNFLQLVANESPIMNLSSITYPISGASTSFTLKTYYLSE